MASCELWYIWCKRGFRRCIPSTYRIRSAHLVSNQPKGARANAAGAQHGRSEHAAAWGRCEVIQWILFIYHY